MRTKITSGSHFEHAMAYSRAIVDGNWLFVSGTTGFNYETMTISECVVEQAEQCFKNIIAAMEKVDFTLSEVVRVRYILPKAEDFEPCWPVLQKYFGDIRPAATMFVAGLQIHA